MLCYAMQRYAMLCYAMLCYTISSSFWGTYAGLCHATLCHAVLCYAMLCYTIGSALFWERMLCYTMQRYAMRAGTASLAKYAMRGTSVTRRGEMIFMWGWRCGGE